jgi:hypothetical protein
VRFIPAERNGIEGVLPPLSRPEFTGDRFSEVWVKSQLGSSSGRRSSEEDSAGRKTNRPRLMSSPLAKRTCQQAKRTRAQKRK